VREGEHIDTHRGREGGREGGRAYPLRVDEFTLPRLEVPEEVGDELVLFVGHAGAEVGDALRREGGREGGRKGGRDEMDERLHPLRGTCRRGSG